MGAVVAAQHLDDAVALHVGTGSADSEHGGLGAGVAEADQIHMLHAAGDDLGQLHLLGNTGGAGSTLGSGLGNGLGQRGMGVAVNEGGVVVQEVDVHVAVQIVDAAALAVFHGEGIGVVAGDGTALAASHVLPCLLKCGLGLGGAGHVDFAGLLQRFLIRHDNTSFLMIGLVDILLNAEG